MYFFIQFSVAGRRARDMWRRETKGRGDRDGCFVICKLNQIYTQHFIYGYSISPFIPPRFHSNFPPYIYWDKLFGIIIDPRPVTKTNEWNWLWPRCHFVLCGEWHFFQLPVYSGDEYDDFSWPPHCIRLAYSFDIISKDIDLCDTDIVMSVWSSLYTSESSFVCVCVCLLLLAFTIKSAQNAKEWNKDKGDYYIGAVIRAIWPKRFPISMIIS